MYAALVKTSSTWYTLNRTLSRIAHRKASNSFRLLKILPQLYQELIDCPRRISQISRPAFPSLKDLWIDPLTDQSPYRPEVGEAIMDAINRLDGNLLEKYLREISTEMGVILKRQRGMLPFLISCFLTNQVFFMIYRKSIWRIPVLYLCITILRRCCIIAIL